MVHGHVARHFIVHGPVHPLLGDGALLVPGASGWHQKQTDGRDCDCKLNPVQGELRRVVNPSKRARRKEAAAYSQDYRRQS